MLDLDGFFKRHGSEILRFDIKIGGQITRLEFSRDFVLGADRTNPFALQERNDEASSKAATYGTLFVAAKYEFKQKQREFKAWYARVHQEMKKSLSEMINSSPGLAYNMKKAPTAEDVENSIANSKDGDELRRWYTTLDDLEKTMDSMEILYKAACLDAEAARSMSSMGKDMLSRDMISHGQPRQLKVDSPKKSSNSDAEF